MKHYRHGTCLWQRLATAVVAALCAHAACASKLAERIDSIIGDKKMTVGVAAEYADMHFVLNDSVRFPLLSVFKTHGRHGKDADGRDKPRQRGAH